jgi:small nuclear ribonucleoprotein (snRNP)-like protein
MIYVKLKWGLEYKGYLLSSDAYMNLQLEQCEEFIEGKSQGNLGEVLIRHASVHVAELCRCCLHGARFADLQVAHSDIGVWRHRAPFASAAKVLVAHKDRANNKMVCGCATEYRHN